MTNYTHISDLAKEAQPPDKGIRSRTIFNDEKVKAVIFGFARGEELSEHIASMPAVLQFIQGGATVGLADDIVTPSFAGRTSRRSFGPTGSCPPAKSGRC